jgi:glycine/D-amino acid oxidase-like deaminating enzyme
VKAGIDRRSVLKSGGTALLGLGLAGCRSLGDVSATPARPSIRLSLPPVLASWDRIIRTTVGLRPHRPAGFNVSAEKLDDRTVIHNYGHGGAGHSLGWGCGLLAAELALEQPARRAAVIGCGTVGLTTARQLQRRGFDVTIYAKAVPPDTTSNMALAAFTPTSGLISTETTPSFDAQFKRAIEVSYRQLQLLAGRDYGVSWIDGFNTTDSPGVGARDPNAGADANFRGSDMSALIPTGIDENIGRLVLGPGEHPFPSRYAIWHRRLRIEPSIYLDALVRDFLRFGGRLVIRAFDTPRDLMTLDERLIINCTGLGSRTLFGDETMFPVKGQLTVLIPQPEVTYSCRAMPRSDGIALGTTQERNVATLEPNLEAQQRIVDACIKFYSAMRPTLRQAQGRPERSRGSITSGAAAARVGLPSDIPPVESFFGEES